MCTIIYDGTLVQYLSYPVMGSIESTRGATVESLAVAESTRGEVYYFNQSENDNCHRRALTACSFCQGVSGIFMAVSSVTLQPVNYGQYVGNIILASM